MDTAKKWWTRKMWPLVASQLVVFLILCFAYYLFMRTAPRHMLRVEIPQTAESPTPTESPTSTALVDRAPFLEEEDRILFATSSLTMALVTFLLAVFAVFTWIGIKDTVEKKVDEALKSHRAFEQALIDARVGTVYGQLEVVSTSEADKRKFLNGAILYLRRSYRTLANEDEEEGTKAINNLAFYLACRQKQASADEAASLVADAEEAINLAKKSRTSYLRGHESDSDLITTYAFVIAAFAPAVPEGEQLVQDARNWMLKLQKSDKLSEQHKAQVIRNLQKLDEASKTLAQNTKHPKEDTLGVLLKKVWRTLGKSLRPSG